MTLPASGQIAFSDINTEVGSASGYSSSMSWILSNAKTTVGGSVNVIADMNDLHGLTYYLNDNQGNCNNSQASDCNCNCGDHNCGQCVNCTAVNCVVQDSQAYLQPNCNCACTYNCTHSATSINCNCNCSLVCACACSDITLKRDVVVISGALDKVNQLEGVYYSWNGQAGYYGKVPGQRTMGVIANKTQPVVPEVVGQYKDVLTVDHEGLNGLLIEAIKELSQQVNDLKGKQ
jgi:hypothetical protein